MAGFSDITFTRTLSTLQQLCGRQNEFPMVVKTRNRMLSFPNSPIEPVGKELFLEKEMVVRYARIKVLPFHDEARMLSERGAEAYHLYTSFVGEEFYIPLRCPGSLKIVPHPGKRPRYVTVSEVMKDNPRYLRSNSDVITLTPKEISEKNKSAKCIPSGTILEPKAIIHHGNSRYLKCVDSNGQCYCLAEGCRVNFTALPDERDYTMEELWTFGILRPTPIQFNPGTISPHDVVVDDDDMARDNLVITSGPLEVIEVVSLTVLVSKLRQSNKRCFKTALLPNTVYNNFHVHEGKFQSTEKKSRYLEKKFGGCLGDNDFVLNRMYLFPVQSDLVCWVRSPKQMAEGVHFCDSSDSDSDYEVPDMPEPTSEPLPPLPERKANKEREVNELKEALSALHTVVLLPTAKVKDQDVIERLKQKARLGFGHVHDELKRFVLKRKPTSKVSSKECKSAFSKDFSANTTSHKSNQTDQKLTRAKSIPATPVLPDKVTESSSGHARVLNRPLPSLPRDAKLLRSVSDSSAGYLDMGGRVNSDVEQTPQRMTARIRPMPSKCRNDDSDKQDNLETVDAFTPQTLETVDAPTPQTDRTVAPKPQETSPVIPEVDETDDNYLTPVGVCSPANKLYQPDVGPTSTRRCDVDLTSGQRRADDEPTSTFAASATGGVKELQTTSSFFTYSVQETVNCLKFCGLKELAEVCDEQKLDGDFFKSTDETTLKELLNLSGLSILKLRKIYNGWRPKY